jgi:hypothetical protein
MVLNENTLIDNYSDIEVGDWFSIMTAQRGQFHAIVMKVSGNELLLKQKSDKKFIVTPNTAIQEDVITLHTHPGRKDFPLNFTKIIISDRDRKLKFNITPEVSDEPDSGAEEKILADVKANRAKIMEDLAELGEGDQFDLCAGDTIYDNDGESVIKTGSETILRFKVVKVTKGSFYTCQLVPEEISGKYANYFNKFKDENFYFYLNSNLINTKYDRGVAIQLWRESNKDEPIIFKDVYLLDIIEGPNDTTKDGGDDDEGDDDDIKTKPRRSLEDLLKDKDLMKLMNHQSVWDKVLGRKPKGIKPMHDLMNKRPLSQIMGEKKRKGQNVSFIYMGQPLEGRKLSLEDGKTYHGYMRTDDQIKLSGGKNTDESIILALGDMVDDMYYKVKISHKSHYGTLDRSKIGYVKFIN